GIRYKELITLKVSDLNGDILTILGKGQKIREVWIPPTTLKVLKEYLKIRNARPGNDTLFLNSQGEALTYAGGRQILYEIAKRAGVHFSAHMGRRFYATYLYRNGVGIEEIRQLLGHSKISTTQDYLKITQDDVINDLRKRNIDFFEGTLPALPEPLGMLPTGFEPVSRD
ncbi:MAG: tyrosine-type recombinase/integrase, partial [Thermoplasmata archaeon]